MNKPIRRWMVFLVCIAFAGQLLVGCSAKSQGVKTDRSDKKQLKIGFTIDTLVLERWTRDRDVFTAVIIWKSKKSRLRILLHRRWT